jgi:hypothetical protein
MTVNTNGLLADRKVRGVGGGGLLPRAGRVHGRLEASPGANGLGAESIKLLWRIRLSRCRMIWLLPPPFPVSKSFSVSLMYVAAVKLTDWGGGEEVGGGRSQIIRQQESLVLYESFITPLCGGGDCPSFTEYTNTECQAFCSVVRIGFPHSLPPQASAQAVKITFWPVFLNINFVQFVSDYLKKF